MGAGVSLKWAIFAVTLALLADNELPRIPIPRTSVNKGKAGRAGAIRPWPSKCCQSGAEFASYDLLTPHKQRLGCYRSKIEDFGRRSAVHTTEHRRGHAARGRGRSLPTCKS